MNSTSQSKLADLLTWEKWRFSKALDEARKDRDAKQVQLIEESNNRGFLRSGMTVRGLLEIDEQFAREVCLQMVGSRKQSIAKAPELGSEENLALLRQRIEEFIDLHHAGIPTWMLRERLVESDRLSEDRAFRLKGEMRRELEIMSCETRLGMNQTSQPNIVINIDRSTVQNLNLGTVVGYLQASIGNLTASGHADVAHAMKAITEGILQADLDSGTKQKVTEALSELASQATLASSERRGGVIESLLKYVSSTVTTAANLGQLWERYGKVIENYFGS